MVFFVTTHFFPFLWNINVEDNNNNLFLNDPSSQWLCSAVGFGPQCLVHVL